MVSYRECVIERPGSISYVVGSTPNILKILDWKPGSVTHTALSIGTNLYNENQLKLDSLRQIVTWLECIWNIRKNLNWYDDCVLRNFTAQVHMINQIWLTNMFVDLSNFRMFQILKPYKYVKSRYFPYPYNIKSLNIYYAVLNIGILWYYDLINDWGKTRFVYSFLYGNSSSSILTDLIIIIIIIIIIIQLLWSMIVPLLSLERERVLSSAHFIGC